MKKNFVFGVFSTNAVFNSDVLPLTYSQYTMYLLYALFDACI